MNKANFVRLVAGKLDSTNAEAEKAINTVFNALTEVMLSNDSYCQQAFGTFSIKHKDATTARNPKTGDTIDVPAKYVPKMTFTKTFKDTIATVK